MLIDAKTVNVENWPLRVPFRISRGAKTEAAVVSVSLRSGAFVGSGECCPYARYGETVASITSTLGSIDLNEIGGSSFAELRAALQNNLLPGSARNALDCALWDLEAKASGVPVWKLAGLPKPVRVATCLTLSLDTPQAMAAAALEHADCPLLKLKLGNAADDVERMKLVRAARPAVRLVADANEGWLPDDLMSMLEAAEAYGVELIEQPLPAATDGALGDVGLGPHPIFCADESAAPGSDIRELARRYQAVNVKLDKTGGLTGAIEMIADARRLDLKVMVGSMVSTSLSMAPAALLGSIADWVDLDSPLLLAEDRPAAMEITGGVLSMPTPELWG